MTARQPAISQPGASRLEAIVEFVRRTPPLDVHTTYTYWVLLEYSGRYCRIAEVDGEVVGWCCGVLDRRRGLLWQIGVSPSTRGSGLGLRLVTEVADALEADGAQRLDVTISETNASSLVLFERFAAGAGSTLQPREAVPLGGSTERRYEVMLSPPERQPPPGSQRESAGPG